MLSITDHYILTGHESSSLLFYQARCQALQGVCKHLSKRKGRPFDCCTFQWPLNHTWVCTSVFGACSYFSNMNMFHMFWFSSLTRFSTVASFLPVGGKVGTWGVQLSPVQHSIPHCSTNTFSSSLRRPPIAAHAAFFICNNQTNQEYTKYECYSNRTKYRFKSYQPNVKIRTLLSME